MVKIKLAILKFLQWPFIRFVTLPGLIVYASLILLSKTDGAIALTALLPSFLTALVGWLNNASLNHKGFVKSESSKYRDAISTFVDKFFDDVEEKRINSSNNSLEDFITGKITILELRLNHLKTRTGVTLITLEKLGVLRQVSLLDFSLDSTEKTLSNLRFDLLEHIEINYSDWFVKNRI